MKICHEITQEDHILVTFGINSGNIPSLRFDEPPLGKKSKWDKVGDVELEKYRRLCERSLSEVITCNNLVCSKAEHQRHTEKVYNEVLNSLNISGVNAFVSAPARK